MDSINLYSRCRFPRTDRSDLFGTPIVTIHLCRATRFTAAASRFTLRDRRLLAAFVNIDEFEPGWGPGALRLRPGLPRGG